jgi:hypothetical protein
LKQEQDRRTYRPLDLMRELSAVWQPRPTAFDGVTSFGRFTGQPPGEAVVRPAAVDPVSR